MKTALKLFCAIPSVAFKDGMVWSGKNSIKAARSLGMSAWPMQTDLCPKQAVC